jgi:hypothetical protein
MRRLNALTIASVLLIAALCAAIPALAATRTVNPRRRQPPFA